MSKILLNLGFDYFSSGRTGVGMYAGNIIWGLDSEYDIIVPQNHNKNLPKNAHPIELSKLRKSVFGILKNIFPISFFYKEYNLVITDGICFKRSKRIKQIVIVHDLMSFTEPHNYTHKQKIYHKIAASSYKNADKIIAVSQATKQALHDLFKIDYNKIIVIPNITCFYTEHIASEYFLFIGDMRKTKNLVSLITGFSEYVNKYNGNEKLIIAGNKKFEYMKISKLSREHNIENKVEFPGYITDEQKQKLFSKAKAFIFLSDNEGFGIPLLEAGVNGIPVLCSDIPVFHEVLNESFAEYVNNKKPGEIAKGLNRVKNKKIVAEDIEKLKSKYSINEFNKKINNIIENELTI